MKLLQRLTSDQGAFVATVNWDGDWREYRVNLYVLGVKLAQCSYHTENRGDAVDTARAMLADAPAYYPWALNAATTSQAVAS